MTIMKRFLLGWMIAGMLCWGSMPVLAAAQPSASRAAQVQDGIAARRAYEHLAQRIDRHYRTMPVIGDIQYEHTKAAIRNNRAHQTPLSTSELLFARCMHDGNYAEASAIAVMAVFDAYEPAERAHFRLRQAETMIVRQIDLRERSACWRKRPASLRQLSSMTKPGSRIWLPSRSTRAL